MKRYECVRLGAPSFEYFLDSSRNHERKDAGRVYHSRFYFRSDEKVGGSGREGRSLRPIGR